MLTFAGKLMCTYSLLYPKLYKGKVLTHVEISKENPVETVSPTVVALITAKCGNEKPGLHKEK